jgi:hypothetical protein
VADRRNLAVSKPNPLNVRQEAFARNIAEGRCQREAYQRAGYTPASDSVADVNASRLLRHAQVQSRVRELQAAQARPRSQPRGFWLSWRRPAASL